jgi:cysteine sulfinate desulfinase/cysteine desulfurase-like protein
VRCGSYLWHFSAGWTCSGGLHDTADDPRMNDLYRYLTENGVVLAIRRGVLRFSMTCYNNTDDVDRVLELTRSWLKQQ